MTMIKEHQCVDYNKKGIFQATNFLRRIKERGEEINFSRRESSSNDFNFGETIEAEYKKDGSTYKIEGSTNRKGSNLRITVREFR